MAKKKVTTSKAQAVRDYMAKHTKASPTEVAAALAKQGLEVTSRQVSDIKNRSRKTSIKGSKGTNKVGTKDKRKYVERPYPQKSLEDALRIPQLIKEKNGGNPWPTAQIADACGYTNLRTPAFVQLTRSSRDFGLTIGSNTTEEMELADLGRGIVYPEEPQQEHESKIKAFFNIDVFKKVYEHYGGSQSFPEKRYLSSTLDNKFGLVTDLHDEFTRLFKVNCSYLGIEDTLGTSAIEQEKTVDETGRIRVVGKAEGKFDRTAFVIMPFSEKGMEHRPEGFFSELLDKLITPAGNVANFAVKTAKQDGSDVIQSTIIDQLLQADLVIADLTDHNPNVLFELGIRIAKDLPVALISAEGTGRVFDVDNLMRVLHYDPNLWSSTVSKDLPRLTDHIKAAWDNRTTYRTYMQILTGQPSE